VYTLDAKKAKPNNDLIAGTCYMHQSHLFVLLDFEANHSFFASKYVPKLGLELSLFTSWY
jgi:hypothetical protein